MVSLLPVMANQLFWIDSLFEVRRKMCRLTNPDVIPHAELLPCGKFAGYMVTGLQSARYFGYEMLVSRQPGQFLY
jgi:hypothetical protein